MLLVDSFGKLFVHAYCHRRCLISMSFGILLQPAFLLGRIRRATRGPYWSLSKPHLNKFTFIQLQEIWAESGLSNDLLSQFYEETTFSRFALSPFEREVTNNQKGESLSKRQRDWRKAKPKNLSPQKNAK